MSAPAVITYVQPFEMDSTKVIDSAALKSFALEIDSIMRQDTITHVEIVGIASVDGPESLNRELARNRAIAMRRWMTQTTTVPADIISLSSNGEDWSMFRSLVEADKNIPGRERVLEILASNKTDFDKEVEIKMLEGGRTWIYLAEHTLPLMRCAEITLNVKHHYEAPRIMEVPVVVETVEEVVEIPAQPEPELIAEDEWQRNFRIKTDLPYWLMTWSNVAFEIDLAKHWSFNLPITFSAMNYFNHKTKFRNFTIQPGIRYWLKETDKGVYFEAHYGLGWFNFAFNGKYRYQDHWRHTPTQGGGIGAGYRLPITKNGRWMMEFGGGVGVYRLNYDKFINEYNGKLVGREKKTVFFLDNVNVSIGYNIPVGKKKGGSEQ